MSGAKILVVDDDLQIRRVMRKMLTAQGYAVNDVRSGEEALDRLRRDRHDLSCWIWPCPGWAAWKLAGLFAPVRDVAIIILSGPRPGKR